MNWQPLILALSISFGSLLWAKPAPHQPTSEKVQVNGFDVYLVDVKMGNQFGYVFTVPYGSSDDEQPLFGRAHWYEHMYFTGSQAYPGYQTMRDVMTETGFQTNAWTSHSSTTYYGVGIQDQALKAMTVQMAPLHGLELPRKAVVEEKKTVIDEIVTTAPNRPARAIFHLPFMYLPSPDHPLRGHFVGDATTLPPMSPADLHDLHHKIYHNGNVRLAVVGNFTSGKWTRADVLKTLADALPAETPKQAPYVPAQTSPIFAQDQILEARLDSARNGFMLLPLDPSVDPADLRAFTSMYNATARGSLVDIGYRQMGWLHSLNFSDLRVGSHNFLVVGFEMTTTGFEHRDEVAQWLLEAIKIAREESLPEHLFAQVRRSFLQSAASQQTSVSSLVNSFGHWLGEPDLQDLPRLDWPAVMRSFNADAVRRAAQGVRFENKAVTYLGPVPSAGLRREPFFNLEMSVRPWLDAQPTLAPFRPSAVAVASPTLPTPQQTGPLRAERGWSTENDWTFMRNHRAEWNDRSVRLALRTRELTPLEHMSLEAWLYTASFRLAPDLAYLRGKGIQLGIDSSNGELTLIARGNAGQEFAALEWLLAKLMEIRPTATEIANFRDYFESSLLGMEQGFPGQIVAATATSIFQSRDENPLSMTRNTKSLSTATVENFKTKVLRQTAKTFAVAGSFHQSEVDRLREIVRHISPEPMDARDRRIRVLRSEKLSEPWLQSTSAGISAARLYNAAAGYHRRDQAALLVITTLLHDRVFERNRRWGYIQGVSRKVSTLENQQLMFYGQAENEQQLERLQLAWDQQIRRWLNGRVDDKEIERGRDSVLAQLSKQEESSAQSISRMTSLYWSAGDPFAVGSMLAEAKALTRKEIIAVARTYLGPQNPHLTLIKGVGDPVDCQELLSQRNKWRKENSSPN